jgi:hypothetical protein
MPAPICSSPAFTGASAWSGFGGGSPDETLGLEFIANADLCTGGWVYTGPGAGWSGTTAYLFDAATTGLITSTTVITGTGNTGYAFNWHAAVSLTPGHHYVIAILKGASSGYAGNVDNALPGAGAFYTPVEWRYSVGAGAFPTTNLGARVGVEPTVCNSSGYCQFGTRLRPDQQLTLVITEGVIAALALAVPEVAFLAVAFGAFIGWTFVPDTVCSSPPPAMPVFTDADFLFGTQLPAPGSIPKFWQAFQASAWFLYCECAPNPGGVPPDPIPHPPPLVVPPGGAPPPIPPIRCDGQDVCSTLDAIVRQLNAMSAQLGFVRSDVQLIQRQAVPFGYVVGAVHGGLTDSGTLTVANILGIRVVFTTIPSRFGRNETVIPEYIELGYVSFGTSDGFLSARVLTHERELVLDVPGDITQVNYDLQAGIVADIAELLREP